MKKLLLLLCTLLGTAGAWAEVLNVTPADGTYVTSSGNYVNSISFATNPVLTVTASANNMDKRQTGDYLLWHSGSSGSSTYTLIVPNGCKITEYSITGEANTSAQTLTAGQISHEFAVGASSTFTVTGLNATSTSFVQTGANASGLKITAISVTILKPSDAQLNAYNTVQGWIPVIQSSNGLVKNASNYISNAKSTAEGSYEGLLDGDYATYFHSAYGSQGPNEDHYLQGEMSKSVNAVYFYYKKRSQNNNNRPTSITISGSNDGTNFTEVTTVSSGLPTDASVIDYTSDKINLGASYKYLRFTVTATNSGAASNGHVFFTFSEFYILPSNNDIDAAITAYKSYKDVAAVDLTDAQIADINAVNTALTSTIVNVTYELYESDGTTLVASTTVEQLKNSEVNIPASFENPYYNLTSQGTIKTSDCTIKVIRTLKDGIVYPVANLNNNKAYYIKTRYGNRGSLSTYTDGDVTYLASPVKSALGLNASGKKFAIINYEDHYYLYSVEDQKFVTYQAEQKAPLAAEITGISDAIAFSATTAPLYELRFDGSASKIINSSGSYLYGLVFNGWGAGSNQWDDGCQYTIEEAGTFDPAAAIAALTEFFHPSITVTYIVKDSSNKTLFTSDAVGTTIGAQITTLPEEYQFANFYTYNTVNVTISKNGNTNVTFTATPKENPVFNYTANTTNPVWYYLKIKNANYVTYVADGSPNVTLPASYTLGDNNVQWAFVGEPYAGFQIINRAATGLVLGSGSAASGGNNGGNTHATMAAAGTQTYEKFLAVPSNYLTDGFFLFNEEGYALNQRSTENLAYWTGGYDKGSTFTVEKASDNYYSMVETEILPYLTSNVGKPFGISQAGATSIQSTYRTQLTNKNFTLAQYQEAKAMFDASILYPEDGKTYLVKNTSNNKYLRVAEHGVRGQVFADLTAEEAAQNTSAHVFVRYINNKPFLLSGGYYFNWVYSNVDGYEAYTTEARASDKYAHFVSVAPGIGAFSLALGNGEGPETSSNGTDYSGYINPGFYALKNGTTTVAGSTTDYTNEYAQWIFEEVEAPANGDVNMDGETTVADVADLVAYLVGKANVSGGMSINQNAADLDNNGTITLRDVTLLVNKIKSAQ